MSFTFNCPICNQSLEAEEEWIGQQAECPGCGQTVTIKKKLSLKTQEQSPSYVPTIVRETDGSFKPAGDSYQAINYQAYNDHFRDIQRQNDVQSYNNGQKSSELDFKIVVGVISIIIIFIFIGVISGVMSRNGGLSGNSVSSSSTASNSSTNSSNAYQEMAEDTKTQTAKLVFITNCIDNPRLNPP